MAGLRMSWSFGIQLTESLQVIQGQLVTQKMEKDILERAAKFRERVYNGFRGR
jgi:hypothetical protein